MKVAEAIPYVKRQLTDERFQHTMRVVEQAQDLAKRFELNEEKVGLAAVFHDYAKDLPVQKLKQIIKASDLPQNLLQFHHELWHGPVGAILTARDFDIVDHDIHDAIYYHTTGREKMSQLELIIYVADYIEPKRNFPGVEEVREMAQTDFIHAAWMATRNTIQFLLQKKALIYPDTIDAYNDLTKRVLSK